MNGTLNKGQRVETNTGRYGVITHVADDGIATVRLDNGMLNAYRIERLTPAAGTTAGIKATGRCEAYLDAKMGGQCKRTGRLIPGFGYACHQHCKGVH